MRFQGATSIEIMLTSWRIVKYIDDFSIHSHMLIDFSSGNIAIDSDYYLKDIFMCQFICCDCWWCNWCGAYGGVHAAFCLCSYWLCKPDSLAQMDPDCCKICKCDGWGGNCCCWGDIICAPQVVKDWSGLMSGGGSGNVVVVNNNYWLIPIAFITSIINTIIINMGLSSIQSCPLPSRIRTLPSDMLFSPTMDIHTHTSARSQKEELLVLGPAPVWGWPL